MFSMESYLVALVDVVRSRRAFFNLQMTVTARSARRVVASALFFTAAAACYAVLPTVPVPVISPASGTYSETPTVTISDLLIGATIFYTVDGTTPTVSSPVYSNPFAVNGPWVAVQAIAVKPGYANSAEASAVYTLNSTVSTLSVSGANPYQMTCSVFGAAIPGVSGPTGQATFSDTTAGVPLATGTLGTPSQSRTLHLISNNSIGVIYAYSPTVADLNGDGHFDLVMGTESGIQVLLGNGDGTFQPASLVVSSDNESLVPFDIAVGDFNGDGKPDIIYTMAKFNGDGTTSESTSYGVLAGNGDGTFQPPVYYDAGIPLYWIATGDFNRDRKLDVAITNASGGQSVVVMLGNGNGTFQPPVYYAAGDDPVDVLAADFNGDGYLDLAVSNSPDGTVSVLLGNGDGTFQPQLVTPSFGKDPGVMAAGDFNQDGRLDLAVSFQIGSRSAVAILLGNGDGTFQYQPSLTIKETKASNGFTTADFNEDGNLDLAISELSSSTHLGSIQLELGVGNGTFQAGPAYSIPSSAALVVATDLNGDGYPDLVAAGYSLLNEPLASASATVTDVFVAPGTYATHQLQCTYDGDAHYGASYSNFVEESYSQVAPPVFSLLVGVYNAPQTVTITDATAGALIYYTTDGSTPTTSSTQYSGPIAISSQTTFKAIGAMTGDLASVVSEAVYDFAATPQLSPPPGAYSSAESVTISDSTPNPTIYYTTDGSTPTTHSAVYSQPIPVNAGSLVQALATAPNHLNSSVVRGAYSIGVAATNTTLIAFTQSANENQQITLTASVTGSNFPSGTVTFFAGSTALGSATLINGSAVLQVSFAAAGNYSVTASYGSDSSNSGSTSSTVIIRVTALQYTLSVNPPTQTIQVGQSATFKITATPVGGFSSPINFTCSALPAGASCVFSPPSVTPNGASASTTLTISTTAATAAVDRRRAPGPWAPLGGGAALAGALGMLLRKRRLRWSRALGAFSGLLLTALALAASSCGGGGSGSSVGNPGTPTGSYTVSVIASASGGSNQPLQLTLIVQ